MKKFRFVSFFLSIAIIFSLCFTCASAYQSDIVDSMSVEANAALLIDMDTGLILYEQNAYDRVYPASITKVMTALLVIEALNDGTLAIDQMITADDSAWSGLDYTSSNQNIQVGETMSVEDLLYCLLVASANEAANILAVAVSGSLDDFIILMNKRAEELGCTDTNYTNTNGMPDEQHYTTAYDIYLIAKEAMGYELFRTIVATSEYYTEATNMTESSRHFYNTNALLTTKKYAGYIYEYCIGIKTGSTDEAGYCLLSAAEKDGQTLICVVMGCDNPTTASGEVSRLQFSESARLYKWGFSNFSVQTILDATDPVAEVAVTMSSECDYVSVIIDGTIEAQLPNDVDSSVFDWEIDLPESVEAPIEKGQVLGTLTLTLDGVDYGSVNLIAVNDVSRSAVLDFADKALKTVTSLKFIITAALVVVFLIALIIFSKVRRARRGNYGGRRRRRKYRR